MNQNPPTEEEVEKPVEQAVEAPKEGAEAVKEETPAPEKRNKVTARERINQLTRDKGDAKREAEALRKEVEELKKGLRIEKEPVEDDYTDFNAYQRDTETFNKQQEADRQAEIDRLAQQRIAEIEEQKRNQSRSEKWAQNKQDAITKYENFQDSEDYVVAVANHYRNGAFQELILEAKDPAAIVDHLANNHKEAEKIASSSLASATRAIIKLETQLEKKPEKEILPPPTDNAGVSGSGVFDPYKAGQAEYNAHMNKKMQS